MKVLNNNLIGKILGTCRLETLIGQGGMSAVFLAEQPHLSRHVAIKVLLPEVVMDSSLHEEFLIRFQREASVVAGLEHVNIMPIYDYGEEEGIAYLVMPYLPKGTLRDVLARRRALSSQEALIYIEQAASALDYAHAHGIIHRDLKPSNFLLHADGRLVLADFGIARMMQSNGKAIGMTLTNTGALLGTPEYMSPEMIQGEQVDHRTDIYELGIVLFQMLSGTVPFRGAPHYVVLMKHLQEPVPLLHPGNPSIPSSVDAVIQKATAKRRGDRYASAGDLARELKIAINTATYSSGNDQYYTPTVLSSSLSPASWSAPTQADNVFISSRPPVIVTPTPPIHMSDPGRKRSWLKWVAVLIAFVLLAGGLLVGLPQVFSQPQPPPKLAPTPAERAQGVVEEYYNALNSWNYPAAYKLLQTNAGQEGYCRFVNGYALTEHDVVSYNGVTQLADGTFKVAITIVATELFPTGTVKTTYVGYELVEPGTWLIKSGGQFDKRERTPVPILPTSSDPLQQAQSVVKQFHNDINTHNYPDAYSQWGADYQKSTSYCSFVAGYTRTQRENVNITNTTQLSEGTVQVAATTNASEETNSGAVTRTYHDTYIVGQENGAWRIISGTQV